MMSTHVISALLTAAHCSHAVAQVFILQYFQMLQHAHALRENQGIEPSSHTAIYKNLQCTMLRAALSSPATRCLFWQCKPVKLNECCLSITRRLCTFQDCCHFV